MNENKFCHVYGYYFKNAIQKVTWYQLFSKFSTIMRHIAKGIWKAPYSWRFYEQGSTYALILFWISWNENGKDASEVISCTKIRAFLWRTLHQDISIIIIFFSFSETNLVFKFNLVLLNNFHHSLFTFLLFDTMCILELIQCL